MDRRVDTSALEDHIKDILDYLGFEGPNFDETPRRVAKLWTNFVAPADKPEIRTFPTTNTFPIQLKGHQAWGFCPHHLLPVLYTFDIKYTPKGQVLGLSKLARIAEYHLKTLPIQEDLNKLICDHVAKVVSTSSVECAIKGFHLCCAMRGTKSEATFHTYYGQDMEVPR